MSPPVIPTRRLDLIPATLAHFAALAEDEARLGEALGVALEPGWLEFEDARDAMAHSAEWLAEHPEVAVWWTYWFVDRAENTLIGLGGFKGEPFEGAVEIGYAIAPGRQLQGFATEAAQGMIDFAWRQRRVKQVLAHTLPHKNGSTAVLTGLGFRHEGLVIDPDDGEIWRWSLRRG
jgi:RimJ/RimL family protein N-acetyltransferase